MKANLTKGKYLIILLLGMILASCSNLGSPGKTPQTLRVEWMIKEGDYTLIVAKRMGTFEKYGIIVEPVFYQDQTTIIQDIAGTKLDGGLLSMAEFMLAANATDLKGVMVYDSGVTYSLVGSPDITSVRSLRDKRIGVNMHTSGEMFVTYMLSSVSMNQENVRIIDQSPAQVAENIPAVIDAGVVWEPYTSQAIQAGNAIIYNSDRYSAMYPGIIVFRKIIVEKYPDSIRAFIQAWNEATNYRITHPQESLAIIKEATRLRDEGLGITGNDKLYTIEDNLALFAENPGKNTSSIYYIAKFNLNFFSRMGYITKAIDLTTLLDPGFLR